MQDAFERYPIADLRALVNSIKHYVDSTATHNIQKHMLLLQSKLGIRAYEYEFYLVK